MKRVTIRHLQTMKADDERIVVLTAYDATSARLAEAADVPVLLVGDTLGMVIQGQDSTVPVTMEHMIYHCAIVERVTERPLIICDLPFMSYSVNVEQALSNAARLMQEGHAGAVKLEGGEKLAPTIRRVVDAGIPVMAHIGLTPQSVNQVGGFRVQGKHLQSARQLVRDALAVQEAGAFSVVLELVPAKLAALITDLLHIPTIGIGAGGHCSGQVQVFHDILALFDDFVPKHTKRYAHIGEVMQTAIAEYRDEVQRGVFPADKNSFSIDDDVLHALKEEFSE
jgi:3-methyl-2-oxobutanoate hydroxymethyltransferase